MTGIGSLMQIVNIITPKVMAVAIRKDELVQRLECTLNGSFNFQNPDIRSEAPAIRRFVLYISHAEANDLAKYLLTQISFYQTFNRFFD